MSNKETKLKALRYFSDKPHDDAKANKFLDAEYKRFSSLLAEDLDYKNLEETLEFLSVFVFRYSEKAATLLSKFVKQIPKKTLEHSQVSYVAEYQTTEKLQVKALDVLLQLRYLQIDAILEFIISEFSSSSGKYREKLVDGIKNISAYNQRALTQIGYEAQRITLDKLDALSEQDLLVCKELILITTRNIFSNDVDVHEWQYQTVSIKTYSIQYNDILHNIRERCLTILFKLYGLLELVIDKNQVIAELNQAQSTYSRIALSDELKALIYKSTIDVLEFYKSLIPHEAFSILQKIEHDTYWTFYHANTSEIKICALEVEMLLRSHKEYCIYNNFIGYDGIFSSWEENKQSHNRYSEVEKLKQEKVDAYALEVQEVNFEVWKQRLIYYCADDERNTQLLTSFVFNVAKKLPHLFLSFIQEYKNIERIISPALRGLWHSENQPECKVLILSWIKTKQHLLEISSMLTAFEDVEQELLEVYFDAALDSENVEYIIDAVRLLTSNWNNVSQSFFDEKFRTNISKLTEHSNYNWVNYVWHLREMKSLVDLMKDETVDVLFENLLLAKNIDYQVEEIAFALGQRDIDKLYNWFGERVENQKQDKSHKYDAIPFNLHKLKELFSLDAEKLICNVSNWYDGDYYSFIYRGADLVCKVFPFISSELEMAISSQLLSADKDDIYKLLAILRPYNGHESILDIVCKLIVIIEGEKQLNEVDAILLSTGVVSGEYGFVEAYKQKKELVLNWLESSEPKVVSFAQKYINNLDQMIENEKISAEESEILMKHKYGFKGEEKGAE